MQAKMVSFGVQPAVYAGLEQRGRTMGLAPGKYAQRLFEAAYAARCLAERGEESGDAALDRHVRQVFLLADCEPEFIADALAMPQARVERILAGWKRHFSTASATDPTRTVDGNRRPTGPKPTENAVTSPGGESPAPPPCPFRARKEEYALDRPGPVETESPMGRGQADRRDRRRPRPHPRHRTAIRRYPSRAVPEAEGVRR